VSEGGVSERFFGQSSESGVVQTLIDEHTGDNQEHNARGRTQDLDEGIQLVDLGNDLRLILLCKGSTLRTNKSSVKAHHRFSPQA
jgi:hypothetical protein